MPGLGSTKANGESLPMERVKGILTAVLLGFTLISIGFALGKHSVKSDKQTSALPKARGRQVAVYYLHSTFRCETCNTIEKMTGQVLNDSYRNELAEGKVLWIVEDFQEKEALAKKFEVVASCVVVAEMKNGVVLDYRRLDDVWSQMKDQKAFTRYIENTIDQYLKQIGWKS